MTSAKNIEGLTCESGLENTWLLSSGDHGRRCMLQKERQNHNNQSLWIMYDVLKTSIPFLIAFEVCRLNYDNPHKWFKRISDGPRGRQRESAVNVPHSGLLWVLNEIGGMWYPLHILCCNSTIPMAPDCVGDSCTYSLGTCLESGEQLLLPTLLSWTNKL